MFYNCVCCIMKSDAQKPTPRSLGEIEPRTLRLDLPPAGLVLEQGGSLKQVDVAYEICGRMAADASNVIYICHALTGDAHVAGIRPGETQPDGWWEGMVGPGKGIDTDYYCVICSNMLSGCKGTTGPSSINPDTGEPYGSNFPAVTVRDMVAVRSLQQLGIRRLRPPSAAVWRHAGARMGHPLPRFHWTRHRHRRRCQPECSGGFDIIGRRSITEDPRWRPETIMRPCANRSSVSARRGVWRITYLSEASMADSSARAAQA